jgi:hypothetical protein
VSRTRLPRTRGIAAAALVALALAGCGGGGASSAGSRPASTPRATPSTASAPAPGAAGSATASAKASAGSSHTASASAGGVTATLRAGTHRPRAQRAWPISFEVRSAGGAVAASVEYEYVFAGQVVAHRSHYRFRGRFSDVFHWPASAVGYPLTFRAVIRARGRTIDLDYPVQVAR